MSKFLSTVFNSPIIKKNKMEKVMNQINYVQIAEKIKIPYPMKNTYNCVIPADIYQTWHTKNLPPLMLQAVKTIQAVNPKFNYTLFDDNDCRNFIQDNFDRSVLDAFDILKPGAYKADLWRYCILYKRGGVYLDIKYIPVNGFKLINLLEKEHWVLDADKNGVYNAVMVCKAGNPILLNAINQIVEHVKNKYYGNNALEVTGPLLLARYFNKDEKNNFDMKHFMHVSQNNRFVSLNNYIVLKSYNGYINESKKFQKNEYYGVLWNNRNIYN
jgi:mannosyltransferase OCH1-like enzyme